MKAIITSATLWRFLGGFALGTIGVLTLHPATAESVHSSTSASAPAQR